MSARAGSAPVLDVVELNPYAPRPYVFTEAALCLHVALRAAGCDSQLRVNQADPARATLVLGALPPRHGALAGRDPSRTAVYNLEQLGGGPLAAGPGHPDWLRRWPVADYHRANIDWLRRGGPVRAVELPLLPCDALCTPVAPAGAAVDVLFYGTPSPRRDRVLQALRATGLRVDAVAGAYGVDLAPRLARARLVLHVHYYDTALFPIARLLQPLAREVPVVCEQPVFSPRSDWSGSGIAFAPNDGLVAACHALLAHPAEAAQRARDARRHAGAIDFGGPLRELLALLDGPPRPLAAPRPPG